MNPIKETPVLPPRHCEAHKSIAIINIQAPRAEAISQLERQSSSLSTSYKRIPLNYEIATAQITIEVSLHLQVCASQ
jgi:hypothetical protein